LSSRKVASDRKESDRPQMLSRRVRLKKKWVISPSGALHRAQQTIRLKKEFERIIGRRQTGGESYI
jgi:hypothetical protein